MKAIKPKWKIQVEKPSGNRIKIKDGVAYPSSTTILSILKKPYFIKKWREEVFEFSMRFYHHSVELVIFSLFLLQARSLIATTRGTYIHYVAEMIGNGLPYKNIYDCKEDVFPGIKDELRDMLIYQILNGDTVRLDGYMLSLNTFFKQWKDRLKIISQEERLYVNMHGLCYCGQYDAIAEVDGVLTMIDYKTSKDIEIPIGPIYGEPLKRAEYFAQMASYVFAYNLQNRENKVKQAMIAVFKSDGIPLVYKITTEELKPYLSLFKQLHDEYIRYTVGSNSDTNKAPIEEGGVCADTNRLSF